ncbi:O-antigen ligase family protein [Novosphingobium sp. UBA1939]|uniref:O-antigen ligase family protein n=1 Tax=Novosphingobium sp. UBA1939 TaxID=1946982 RepID=UPI0025FEF4D9|nr:O-antigen ligase family protein [Novosphingobium sp. UBA1939]
MFRSIAARLPSSDRDGLPAFTLGNYHPPERGLLFKVVTGLGIFLIAALIGAAIGGLPINLIAIPLLPVVVLSLIIIWVMPENNHPPVRFMTATFFAYLVAVVLWPYYLAVQIPGLPLIEIRRLLIVFSVLAFLLCFSTSSKFRKQLTAIALESRVEVKFLWAFVAFQALSIPLSPYLAQSMQTFVKNQLGWTATFFIAAYVMVRKGNIDLFSNIVRILAIVLAIMGYFEFRNQRILWADHIPSFLKVSDPTMAMLLDPRFRSDEYRIVGPFSTSLSFAEFMAMAMPFFLHYIFYGRKMWLRAVCIVANALVFYAILLTQARVGIVGVLVAHGFYVAIWTIDKWRQDRSNIIAATLLYAMPILAALSMATVLSVPRLRVMTIGGGTHAASTEGRLEQMRAAIPLMIKRPVIGYGPGQGGRVLGYTNPAGEASIDSYVLMAALSYGVVGFIVMAIMHGLFAAKAIAVGQKRFGETSAALPAATGIVVWMVDKIVLAQEDSVSFVYMLMALVAAAAYRLQIEGDGKVTSIANLRPSPVPAE